MQAAGFPVWVVAGPVRPAAPEDFAETLAAMARNGPDFRVGLVPTRSSRRWVFDDRPPDCLLRTDISDQPSSIHDVVASLEGGSESAPVAVRSVADEFMVVYMDHGIGDSYVMLEVVSALSCAGERRGFRDPRPVVTTDRPFLRACLRAMKKPGALLSSGRRIVSGRLERSRLASSTPSTTASPVRRIVPDVDTPRFVFVRSAPGYVALLREQRRATGTKASLAAILMAKVCDAFRSLGVDIGEDIEVVTDLRKFLPEGDSTLANFVSVVSVPAPPGATAVQLGAGLAAEVNSMTPLVKAAGALGVSALGRLRQLRPGASQQPDDAPPKRVVVSFSDLTKLPLDSRIQYVGDGPVQLAVMLPFTSPSRLSLSVAALRGEIQLTATFSDRLVDPHVIRQVLQRAVQPDVAE